MYPSVHPPYSTLLSVVMVKVFTAENLAGRVVMREYGQSPMQKLRRQTLTAASDICTTFFYFIIISEVLTELEKHFQFTICRDRDNLTEYKKQVRYVLDTFYDEGQLSLSTGSKMEEDISCGAILQQQLSDEINHPRTTSSPVHCTELCAEATRSRSKHGKTVEWTSKDLIKGLEEFVPMWLKPDLMMRAVLSRGIPLGFCDKQCQTLQLFRFHPDIPEKYLKKGPAYVDGNCTYFAGKDFVDFGSVEWKSVMKKHEITDLSRVLIFFDDHQNELKRVKQALNAGFKHLVFEDNYDTGTGDHYSLSRYHASFSFTLLCLGTLSIFTVHRGGHSCFRDSDESRIRSKRKKFWEKAVDIDELCGPNEVWWVLEAGCGITLITVTSQFPLRNIFRAAGLLNQSSIFLGASPVAGPSLTHQTRYDPARTTPPIVDGRYGLFQRLGLGRLETSVFNGYTQMVYLQISEQEN
ncbi:hypothetical protein GH714_035439 [Hevea brasiliensis]|uniref:Uncharacterized protein n=1 Tax=Hevea brasiliensis TaxID=3981 RepID=A0A6A6NDU9_HEVBR|nr:hypothetical protein GH714_035439 [Hevea brasiliensis]